MMNPRIRQNPFESYEDVASGFQDLLAPLTPFFAGKPGHLDLGTHGSVYLRQVREVEAFLRPLWGLGPFITQGSHELTASYLAGIIAGTDPESEAYWGDTVDFDQLFVEMASLSTFLLLNKEQTWDQLTQAQQDNLHAWLMQINDHRIPDNNWHFFRVLVNTAMKHMGRSYSVEMVDQDLAAIDRCYQGKGWYCDGVETQIDYYVSFAIHYYGLLYSTFEPADPRSEVIKERATEFAQTFKYWFAADGEAVAFGRSLTYRFAQVSFFSALVFANVEALPWGEIKGLISRHLHNWMQQDIFTADGLLSVGYHYQNLVMAEGYNAPGSPYWAFKSFVLLGVPKDHPYWQAEVLPLTVPKHRLPLPESKNYYAYNEDYSHLLMYPAGQYINYQSFASAKYSKFVYSSQFGNSVPKDHHWYYEGAYDNCLAVSEDDQDFRTKDLDASYEILADRVIHEWRPYRDVRIRSTIVPLEGCHVRVHEITNDRDLVVYEGGFSTPLEEKVLPKATGLTAEVVNSVGTSGIKGIYGFTEAGIVRPEPNTNLLYPLTVLPFAKANLAKGKHILVSLVTGLMPGETVEQPTVVVRGDQVTIHQGNQHVQVGK